MTKLVFMGTPQFSVPILEGLIDSGYDVLAVVTQPDRPVGRKKVVQPTPVKEAAVRLGLPIFQPEKLSGSEELTKIIDLKPDLLVTAAYGQFLPESLLKVPTKGAINVHASLLPKYRGGAPVHYAIIDGEQETGVTIMEMIKKMDAGGIYAQESLPITSTDDVGTMFDKLSLLGRELLLRTLPTLLSGALKPVPQDEEAVTFSPNITREQEAIDWQKTAHQIDCQVRGMRPWPVAFTTYKGTRWKMLAVQPQVMRTQALPGTIIEKTKTILAIACGEGTVLQILRLKPAGKGEQTIENFLNGNGQQLQVGERLGE
ncbi:methionyl-tRNA formyltransferase [Enterococcus camelliae]|uniref:Methionyl-tRNA formyltransferase n=1 Tax=Enterococcus camelliae TaxID=453959 RepID=A0ABW5TMN3_9ENTE